MHLILSHLTFTPGPIRTPVDFIKVKNDYNETVNLKQHLKWNGQLLHSITLEIRFSGCP